MAAHGKAEGKVHRLGGALDCGLPWRTLGSRSRRMNFLASAIPGLRDIRAPLLAGYAWLLFAWLVLKPEPGLTDATGLMENVVGLAETVGPVATAAGVSVIAYLIGALQLGFLSFVGGVWGSGLGLWHHWRSAVAFQRSPEDRTRFPYYEHPDDGALLKPGGVWTSRPFSRTMTMLGEMLKPHFMRDAASRKGEAIFEQEERDRFDYAISKWRNHDEPEGRLECHRLVLRALPPDFFPGVPQVRRKLERSLTDLEADDASQLLNDLQGLRRALSDEPRQPRLLLGEKPTLFGEADRLRSEAELRQSIAPPIVALIGLLIIEVGSWCFVLLLAPYLLYRQARAQESESRALVYEAISNDKVPSPALARLKQLVDNLPVREKAATSAS